MKNFSILLLLLLFPSISIADMIIGGEVVYHIVKGDNLELIGAKFGVTPKNIIKDNNLNIKKFLRIGQEIKINNRKIVPMTVDNGIIVNIPDRMLYFFKDSRIDMAFPVGLGMPSWRGMIQWRTPTGYFKITAKRKDPIWHVPESMQWKMMMEGKPVKTIVPPGPDNPLGRYALDTSIPGIVIHETICPTSVYQFRSHGCIRVLPENIETFFERVEINTPGEIIYKTVKIAATEGGRIFLEVHKDIYGKADLGDEARMLMQRAGIEDRVNWQKVDRAIKEKSGIAEDVTL
ncbi:MAG: L,D-transpeptidase family protein [Thermodesulfovibrionales bacterium]|nr:L,D-transpeptidase family protein [Thermodesulfovibrionales bacterium]